MDKKPPSPKFKKPLEKRRLTVNLKKAAGKTVSQQRWLMRQLNDPYVAAAKEQGFRSRAAYKLLEIDDKYKFLRPGVRVIDLGCAPGGWTQVCVERLKNNGQVVGVDLQAIDPAITGAIHLQGDFTELAIQQHIKSLLNGPVNVVLSDMAPAATGHDQTDHLRIMGLAEIALDFAYNVLAPQGVFLAKVLQGGAQKELLDSLKRNFEKVIHVKPPSSRKNSRELFVLARGYKKAAGGK